MRIIRVLRLFVLIVIFGGMVVALSGSSDSLAAGDGSEKIAAGLMQRLLAEAQVEFFVRFNEQADLSAAYDMEWSERGWFVYNTLNEVARRSQGRAQAYLDAQGVAYRSFFSGNELVVYAGNLEQATRLARLDEVANVYIPPTYTITPVEVVPLELASAWAGELLANHAENRVYLPDTPTLGVQNTNGDDFWNLFNVRGEGILVANIDTGVRYTHETFRARYACYGQEVHTNCWYDPDGIVNYPVDNVGHGTHTMGTMVGGDDPDGVFQIGMAPGATWIACQGCDTTSCEPKDLEACADWILAPGENPDNRPQIVNNSWGSLYDGDIWFQDKVIAWRAAGIFPAFSAGNNGPECDSLGDPGSFQESFASAAHDNKYELEYTEGSRGPSYWGDDPYTKPNLSGPGVDIFSSIHTTDTAYLQMSGTSMASPHSAGAVALLWSCNPSLVGQIDTTFQLLQNSARIPRLSTCGGPEDGEGNYSFGYGYLDVLQAGYSVCGGALTGLLQGHVYSSLGQPLGEATVTIESATEGSFQTLTDALGAYSIRLPVGSYSVTASRNGYLANTVNEVGILLAETTSRDFYLTYLGLWSTQTWSPCTNLTRFDAEYFPDTGLVYMLGGRYDFDDSGTTVSTTVGTIFSFDPVTGNCSVIPGVSMPIPVSNYTIAPIEFNGEDVLCIFGGRTATGTQSLAVQCYDPLENMAVQIASLPADPYTYATPGALVVHNNQVYLFGGIELNPSTTQTNLAHTFRYDPITNTFTRLDDLSLARGYIQAAVVDGQIYAFGGDVYDGASTLTAQTTTEVMADPEGAGTWDNAAVMDLPLAAGEGRALGFDRDSGYQLAGKVAIIALAQYPGASYEVIIYDVLSNTYDLNYPNLNVPRRNHAAVFVPINTAIPGDGLPGMWVMGGFCTGGTCGGDLQPYGPPEFFPVYLVTRFYIPFIYK